ncbi:MAG TPA: PAS domain-containing protein [Bryobacteraceae bacterium]|nr:PAS domain-containing protein [Bryobacteraceae bacterium]
MSTAVLGGVARPGRLYLASSRISHAVVRSRTRQELLNEVTRILVESGGFAMAFVTWYDPATHELKPVARFGDTGGYVDRIRIFGDERPEGQGPGGLAFRSGVCYLCQDFLEDPRTGIWRDAALESGWRGSAAIPISLGGAPCGIVSAYSRYPWSFGPEEVELFEQVAADVSIGLDRLDADERRRLAEAALATSERRLKLAIDAAALGIFERDMITGQVVWDTQGERLFGYQPGGAKGTYSAFAERIHPDDRAAVEEVVENALNNRAAFVHEFRIIWPDGSVHWISGRGEFTYDESGLPIRLYGATFDIDDRKRAEEALRESEDRLRQAVRTSGIGIFDHDHVRGTIYWSPEQRAIHGWDLDSPVGLDVYYSRVHPDNRARIAEHVRHSHDPAGSGFFDVEHRLLLPDGSVRWTRTRSQTFFEGEGVARHPVRTVGAVTDITEQKRFEEELTKLAYVVEMSSEFIGVATLEGQVVYLNKSAMALVGLENLEEARRKTIFDFFLESDRVQAASDLYPTLMKTGLWSGESRLRHFRTGAAIDAEITCFQIRDEQDKPLYLATVTRDITERRKAEAEKARLENSLFQAQKMESIGRLAGGVAHDFNNMLTVILIYASLAKTRAAEPDIVRSHLDEIVKAAEHSRQITQQLLGFSRRQIIAPKPTQLNSIIADLRNPLARLIGEDIELRFVPEPNLWKTLLDSSQVNQILLNLAINARDAMPNGGKLTIETANVKVTEEEACGQANCKPGDYAMVAISDNGMGMTGDTLTHIFEPFFTTKETGKGTGLGLATVYGIVKQNGGCINVDSGVDRGSTFRIYFPRLMSEAESIEPGRTTAPAGSGGILLVEDDELVRAVTKATLESVGYTPLVAASAEEALRICAQSGSDIRLMLTDVVMPGMTGTELRDRVKLIRPDVKVLFMSGYTSDVIGMHGVIKEGVQFIQKPFTIQELARKIEEMLAPGGSAGSR